MSTLPGYRRHARWSRSALRPRRLYEYAHKTARPGRPQIRIAHTPLRDNRGRVSALNCLSDGDRRSHAPCWRRSAGRSASFVTGPRARRGASARSPTRWSRFGRRTRPGRYAARRRSARRAARSAFLRAWAAWRPMPTASIASPPLSRPHIHGKIISMHGVRQHIHFSLFGPGFATRLITQMYFPGDPLLKLDPIYLSVPDPAAPAETARLCVLISRRPCPNRALGYRFDIVLRGPASATAARTRDSTEARDESRRDAVAKTIGPFFHRAAAARRMARSRARR